MKTDNIWDLTSSTIRPADLENPENARQGAEYLQALRDQGKPALYHERVAGLGDAVSKVTKLLGIPECDGCQDRRETLNNLFPF